MKIEKVNMPQPKFLDNTLVTFKGGIYKIIKINIHPDNNLYSLELLAYLENSTGNIDAKIPNKTEAKEDELEKFEYSSPRYPMGIRLSGGNEVYLVIFKNDTHKYRYNLSGDSSITANLPEEDLFWR